MRKLLSLVLVLMLVVSAMSMALADDEVAYGRFPETVEVHVGMGIDATDTSLYEGDSVDNNVYTRYYLDTYNIKIVVDWTASTTDFNQKVALCIASDNLPDALVVTDYNQFLAALSAGQLYDMTDIYNTYASDGVKGIYAGYGDNAFAAVSKNGRMYALQGTEAPNSYYCQMIVQENWLDELGIEVPKTVDEVYEAAVAIREAAPAGENTIPILGASKNGQVYSKFYNVGDNSYSFDPIFTAMGAYPGFFTVDDEGTVSYGSLTQETRETLEMLAQWYAEGLIDLEFATRDNSGDVYAANNAGIFFGSWWMAGYGSNDSWINNPDVDYQMYPLYDNNGVWNVKNPSLGSKYTIVNANASEDVAKAVMICLNGYQRDASTIEAGTTENSSWQPLRNPLDLATACNLDYDGVTSVLAGETKPEDWADCGFPFVIKDCNAALQYLKNPEEIKDIYHKADYIDYTDPSVSPDSYQRLYSVLTGMRSIVTIPVNAIDSATYVSNDTMALYWSNLESMEDSVVRSIITGHSDISAFDEFVESWYKEGGDKVLESVQAMYDTTH